MAPAGGTEKRRDPAALFLDLVARMPVQHGEEVIGPVRQGARAAVAMADEIERADLRAKRVHHGVVHVPDAHPVGGHAKGVVVGGKGHTADHARRLHRADTVQHLALGQAKPARDLGIGRRYQRQPAGGGGDDAAVCGVDAHALTRKPMKNSFSLGKRRTVRPVAPSIRFAALAIPSGFSQARTNHMFSRCARS